MDEFINQKCRNFMNFLIETCKCNNNSVKYFYDNYFSNKENMKLIQDLVKSKENDMIISYLFNILQANNHVLEDEAIKDKLDKYISFLREIEL